jgi:hypothetical protein
MDNEQVLPYNTKIKDDWLCKANNQIVLKTVVFFFFTQLFFRLGKVKEMDSVMSMEHGQMLSSARINSEPSENM